MDIFAFLLFFVLLYRVGFLTQEDEKNYLSVGNCVSLRGVCALVVMGHHISQWISQSTSSGFLFHYIFDNAGYLAVSVFFFLSGYGLQKSNLSRDRYYRKFLPFRCAAIVIPYVGAGLIYYFIFYRDYGFLKAFFELFTFSSLVSNSWYIIAILWFYLFFYFAMRLCNRKKNLVPFLTFAYCFCWQYCLKEAGYGVWTYNSIFTIAMGTFWATYEDRILRLIREKQQPLFFLTALMVLMLHHLGSGMDPLLRPTLSLLTPDVDVCVQYLTSCLLVISVAFFMRSFRIRNGFLNFIGEISFELYLMHGLFLKIYSQWDILQNHEIRFTAAVLLSSILLSLVLNRLFKCLIKDTKLLVNWLYDLPKNLQQAS